MELKTKIIAEENKQEIIVTRTFELSLELLFTAYIKPEIVEQWMGTRVLKLDSKQHGSYQFETTDSMGNKHRFNGTIHEFVPNERIIRTFEMENTHFPVQLEFLSFEKLTNDSSQLTMHIVYKSVMDRDNILKLPFIKGINIAHNRLENIVNKLKS